MNAQKSKLFELLPDVPKSWKLDAEDKIYTQETLYEYINGGAELFNSYGMKEVISRRIAKKDIGEIRIEVFDMTSSANAFGVFSHTRTNDEGQFGQGSQYFTGSQIFWKDKYYISVVADDENEEIISVINSLSKDISNRVKNEGVLPYILQFIPEKGLVKDGYCYFTHYIWLNSYYYIADDNFLNISPENVALLAKYGTAESRTILLLVDYEVKDIAIAAFELFSKKYLTDSNMGVVQVEDNSWIGSKLIGKTLVAVFNADTEQAITNLIKATQNKIKSKLN